MAAARFAGGLAGGAQLLQIRDVVVERPDADAEEFRDRGDRPLGVGQQVAGGFEAGPRPLLLGGTPPLRPVRSSGTRTYGPESTGALSASA